MDPNGNIKNNCSSNNQGNEEKHNDNPQQLETIEIEPSTPTRRQPPSQPPSTPATSPPQPAPPAPLASPTPSNCTTAPPSSPMWPHRQHIWQAKDGPIGRVVCLIRRACRIPPGVLKDVGDVYVCSRCGRTACRRCMERDSRRPKHCSMPDGNTNPKLTNDNNGQSGNGPDDNRKDGKKGDYKKDEKASGGYRQRSWTM